MIKDVYVKGINTGKNSVMGKIVVVVCGKEYWSLTNSSDYTLNLPMKNKGRYDITESVIGSWFTENTPTDSH